MVSGKRQKQSLRDRSLIYDLSSSVFWKNKENQKKGYLSRVMILIDMKRNHVNPLPTKRK